MFYQSTNLQRYFREIKNYKKLSKEQEIELYHRIKNGDDKALNNLIKANLLYVAKIAHSYTNTGMQIEDLINVGNMGLIIAARKFDPQKHNCRFLTYATFYIKRSMVNELADNLEIIRLPGQVFTFKQKYKKTLYRMIQKSAGKRFPSEDEILEELKKENINISKKMFTYLFRDYVSLDKTISEQDTLHDILPDKNINTNIDVRIENNQIRKILEKEIIKLPLKHQFVLRKCFNLDNDYDEYPTLAAIGKSLKLSRERVRQLKFKALNQLKKRLTASHFF
jgi:RNA polymerase sigma factor (sigma-70 family)